MTIDNATVTTMGLIADDVYNDAYMRKDAILNTNGIKYKVLAFNNNQDGHEI